MRLIAAVLVSGLIIAAPAPAATAQGPAASSESNRFSFKEVADGLLRLDSRTGQVSLCSRLPAGWACQTLPDDRTALESEIARLADENAALKKELAGRGDVSPGDPNASKSREQGLKVPSDAEVDRMMTVLDKMWRRLLDMAGKTQRELDQRN